MFQTVPDTCQRCELNFLACLKGRNVSNTSLVCCWPEQISAAVLLPVLRALHVCILVLLEQAQNGAREKQSVDVMVFSHISSGWD